MSTIKAVENIYLDQWTRFGGGNKALSIKLIYSDPLRYDREVFRHLYKKYDYWLQLLFSSIADYKGFHDQENFKYYLANIDQGLIKKQIIHVFTTADIFGPIKSDHLELAKIYTLVKTVPLQITDTFIDYSISYNLDKKFMTDVNIRLAWLFSNTAIYLGYYELVNSALPRQAILAVSEVLKDLSQAMFACFMDRFNEKTLNSPKKRIRYYWCSPISRLLGSGFYEATIIASLSISSVSITSDMRLMTKNMRRLRQLVDEIADYDEDIRAGELTLPYLYLLDNKRYTVKASDLITRLWDRSKTIINGSEIQSELFDRLKNDSVAKLLVAELHILLQKSKSFERCYLEADQLWREVVTSLSANFNNHNYFDLLLSVTLKRAFLERLKKANWIDKPLEVL